MAAAAMQYEGLLNAGFPSPLVLSSSRTRKLPDTLSRLGIAGGTVYDALVALATVVT